MAEKQQASIDWKSLFLHGNVILDENITYNGMSSTNG